MSASDSKHMTHTEQIGDWHIMARQCRNGVPGFIAFAKNAPFIAGGGMDEPGPMWFEFGETLSEAIERVKRDVLD